MKCPVEINRDRRVVGDVGPVSLRSVFILADGLRGWAIGLGGTILATRDGGDSWQTQTSTSSAGLFSVTVLSDGLRGWAVGLGGTILATRDGGASWQNQISNSSAGLRSVFVLADGLRAWAVGEGGIILVTRDGGASWQNQISNSSAGLFSVTILADGLRGWAVGEGGIILATRNGGASWQTQTSNSNAGLFSVTILADGLRGWAVGEGGIILATRDSGISWQKQTSNSSAVLRSVTVLADGLRGWAVGLGGAILATRDGGTSWQKQTSNSNSRLFSVAVLADGLRGWAVGSSGAILATRNGGDSWQTQTSNGSAGLFSVTFLTDGLRGWAVGENGTILATRDGGASWQTQTSNSPIGLFSVIVLADGLRGWAVGDNGTILATRDGGASWQTQTSNSRTGLFSVTFLADGLHGWAVGDNGTILATRDSGASWQNQTADSRAGLTSVSVLADGLRGWAVGENGTILATRDGGASWQNQTTDSRAGLESVTVLADGVRGWAVGENGTILATRTGGASWQNQTSNSSTVLRSVTVLADGLRGWAVGDNGTILASRDGGVSWQTQTSNSPAGLSSISVLSDGLHSWAVGAGGTIIAADDGGTTWERQGPRYARWPTPCYWAAVGTMALMLSVWVGWRLRTSVTKLANLILGRAVGDAPIGRADEDRLGFLPTVEAVATFLRHAATLPPVTIAVTAPWGRGKSSMMQLLQAQLRRHGLRTVWFNAWHHQKEPVMLAALLNAIVAQAAPPWLSWRGWWFRTHLVWRRFWRQPVLGALPLLLWLLLIPVALSIAAGVVLWPLPSASAARGFAFAWWADILHWGAAKIVGAPAMDALLAGEWQGFLRQSVGALGRDPSGLVPLLVAAWVVVSLFLLVTHFVRAFPAWPGTLLASMGPKFSLVQAEEQTGFRQRFRDHFRDVTECLRPATLSVFIDDLDRCEPAKAAEILEAVNYLTDSGKCFVVLGIARDIVEAQVGSVYKELATQGHAFALARAEPKGAEPSSKQASTLTESARTPGGDDLNGSAVQLDFARNYLRKLIQIEVPVPGFSPDALNRVVSNEEVPQREGQHRETVPQERRRQERRMLRIDDSIAVWSLRLAWFARFLVVLAAGGFLYTQGKVWLNDLSETEAKKLSEVEASRRQALDDLEQVVTTGARTYVAWLRSEVVRQREVVIGETPSVAATPGHVGATTPRDVAQPSTKPKASAGSAQVSAVIDSTRADDPVGTQDDGGRPSHSGAGQPSAPPTPEIKSGQDSSAITSARADGRLDQAVLLLARLDEHLWTMRDQVSAQDGSAFNNAAREAARLRERLDAFATSEPSYPLSKSADGTPGPSASVSVGPSPRSSESAAPGGTPSAPKPVDTALWSRDVPGALLAVLLVITLVFGRERIHIKDSENFKHALDVCSPLLAVLPQMQAPREAKRFVNLSRYLALRFNLHVYRSRSWLERRVRRLLRIGEIPSDVEPIPESHVVALTALWLAAPTAARDGQALRNWIWNPDANMPLGASVRYREHVSKVRELLNEPLKYTGADGKEQTTVPSQIVSVVDRFLQLVGEIRIGTSPI